MLAKSDPDAEPPPERRKKLWPSRPFAKRGKDEKRRSRGEEGSGGVKADGEIEAFSLGHDKKHHLIEFRVRGKWMSVPFSDTPGACTAPITRDSRSVVASER